MVSLHSFATVEEAASQEVAESCPALRNSLLVLAAWLEGEVQVVAWGPGSHLHSAVCSIEGRVQCVVIG